jgi:4-oxalocrotonate tautomerase
MPFLTIKLTAPVSAETTRRVATALLNLTVEVLQKKRELTSVVVEYVAPSCWFIGGVTLTPESAPGVYVEIKVTEGTNTKDQKKSFVEQVGLAILAILGEIQPTSYVVIHEVRGDAWGYHGVTQEARYILDSSMRTPPEPALAPPVSGTPR